MNTQVERRSRRLFARLVDDKSASATARAEYEIFKDMPPAARVDRTWDNGTEASLHMLVDEALGMLTYFADPYSSWQRGSNENRNGRIRRYLPKGTSFEDLTQDELDAIVGEINDTPMKLLGYKTPNEVWDEEMAKLQSKQADPKPAVALTSESGCRVRGGVCLTNIAPPRHGPAPPDIVLTPPARLRLVTPPDTPIYHRRL